MIPEKIAIIGSRGIVGSATSFGLRKIGHKVEDYDLRNEVNDWSEVMESWYAFVCVPTPQKEDGSCDTSIVEEVVDKLMRAEYKGTIIIKSTIPPGTVARLLKKYYGKVPNNDKIIHLPELLRERQNFGDFVENLKVLVVGCYNESTFDRIVALHGKLPHATVRMLPHEAELFKYMHNTINALRVVFANEMYDIATALGADYYTIKEAVLLSSGLPDQYLDCNQNVRGYSSICFNKDIPALIKLGESLGTNPLLIRTIVEANNLLKRTPFSGTRE